MRKLITVFTAILLLITTSFGQSYNEKTDNLLLVKGAVPGAKNGYLTIKAALKK